MKSYLDLVPISAKVHRKQNRMSIFCIVLAVFLVTAIFGMADMFIRGQILQAQQEDGNWHIGIQGISREEAALISARPGVAIAADYGVLNFRGNQGYTLAGKNVTIGGSSEGAVTEIFNVLDEGTFPQSKEEALVTDNARELLKLEIGEPICIRTPEGTELTYTVSGFLKNSAKTMMEDSYGVFLTMESLQAIYPNENPSDYILYLVQFSNTWNAQGEIADIREQFGLSDGQVSENTKLLGLLGQSSDSFMMRIYEVAVCLFLLVLTAGVLMIASSLNSNVAQRTEFFGLVRCIGATPRQVMRLVRREALSWCRFAIPMGVAGGTVLIWALCFILRRLSPIYFGGMPVFGISSPSVAAGVAMGLLTVLLAARSPARRASKVSPLAAVSGNANNLQPVRKAAGTLFFKIDTSLGIHHARAGRKNFVLMVGSFSISIILFLSFSVTVDFMRHALTPLRPWTADLSVVSPDSTCSVKSELIEELNGNPAVKNVFGRMLAFNIPVTIHGEEKTVDLITYEDRQFSWTKDYVLSGAAAEVQTVKGTGLMVYVPQSKVEAGDVVTLNLNGRSIDMEIVGLLSDCPFNSRTDVDKIVCSEDTFRYLTGETDYAIVDIQLSRSATESDVNEIRSLVGSACIFSDARMGNSSTRGAYYCFGLFIYGFLVLIGLITIFNIVNSIAMSVAARMKQYGAFRAIGLSSRQLVKMIVAEASAYAVTGCICGSVLGLMSNKFLFSYLVNSRWGSPWEIPVAELGIITAVVAIAVLLAVSAPVRKIREMSIVDTISAL